MRLSQKNLSITIPILVGGIALCLHGYLGYFSRYIADDFCTAFNAQRLGVLRATWFWYLTWSGRFSASLLDALVSLLGPEAVPAVVPLTIILWLVVLIVFFLIFLDSMQNKMLVALALAITTLFTLFLLAPDIRQSLYWGQGMRSLVPPLLMGTIQMILLDRIRSREWSRLQLGLWSLFSFGWALSVGGFSETYGSFQVAALILALLAVLIVENFHFSSTALFLTSALLGAVGALGIVVLAPGNAARRAFFPLPPGLADLLVISLKNYLMYLVKLVNSPDKILVIVGLFSLSALIGSQLRREMSSRLLLVIPTLIFIFTFICFLPAAYATSDTPPDRTLILPTYFFLLGLIAWGAVSGNLLGKHQDIVVSRILTVLVIVTIAFSASIHSIRLYQSRNEFIQYARFWDETHANILKSKQDGATEIVIPATPNWAALNTPNENPRYWVNYCMSSYYDIPVLAVPDSSSQ